MPRKNVLLNVDVSDNHLKIHYSDDGVGFNLKEKLELKSIGLQSIMSRINFLNGVFVNKSRPGSGTGFEISVPTNS